MTMLELNLVPMVQCVRNNGMVAREPLGPAR